VRFNVKNQRDSSASTNPHIDNTRLITIDILTIDKNSRLTLTKKIKKILSLNPEDKIIVYQDIYNKNILLKVQHKEYPTVNNWILTKIKDNLNNNNNTNIHFQNDNGNRLDNSNDNKFEKNLDTKTNTSVNIKKQEEEQIDPHNLRYRESTLYNTPILLIDDEPDLLLYFKCFLKNEGYKDVKTFSDSKNVIKHILDKKNSSYYKLVIMDIRMPNINGIHLYQILKILNPSIKILFLTALDAVDELTSIYSEVKPSEVLRKPIDPDQFIKAINDKILRIGIQ
jgi:CheY-like chemotaxis protein